MQLFAFAVHTEHGAMSSRKIMAHVTFCDDVRRENTGKLMLIGCYRHVLLTPSMPATFPMCMVMSIVTPRDPHIASLTIRVLDGDRAVIESTPEPEQIQAAYKDAADSPDTGVALEPLMCFDSIMKIESITLDKPTTLRVMVIVDGEELEAGRLHMLPGANGEAAPA